MLRDKLIIAYNLDQIADTLDEGIKFLKEHQLVFAEIRNINDKNIANLTLDETKRLKNTLDAKNISVSAIASPLFKWYLENSKSKKNTDLFGVSPYLTRIEKEAMIQIIIKQATILNTDKIRIFSGLKPNDLSGQTTQQIQEQSELLQYALLLAKESGVQLLLENEPVCYISKQDDYIKMFTSGEYEGLRSWFDIANVYEDGEVISRQNLEVLAPFIDYLHLKDPVANSIHTYTQLGKGAIDYNQIFGLLGEVIKKTVHVSIETHVKRDKGKISHESLEYLRLLINSHFGKISC